MELNYKQYKYIPIEYLEEKCKDLDKIQELKREIEDNKKKRNILLEKIHNLEIQNYLLKKKIGDEKNEQKTH